MPESDGISFTVKELLAQQDHKLDRILDKLESKADVSQLLAVENRIAEIERHGSSQAVDAAKTVANVEKRLQIVEKWQNDNNYLVAQYMEDHKVIENLDDEFKRLNNGFGQRITTAIQENNKKIDEAREKMFTRKEKIYLVGCAVIGALGTIISILVLVTQLVLS